MKVRKKSKVNYMQLSTLILKQCDHFFRNPRYRKYLVLLIALLALAAIGISIGVPLALTQRAASEFMSI